MSTFRAYHLLFAIALPLCGHCSVQASDGSPPGPVAGSSGADGGHTDGSPDAPAADGSTGCENPRRVHILDANNSLKQETNLILCVREDLAPGFELPDRIDRTGTSLCAPESRDLPCPGPNCVHECFDTADCGSGEACLCGTAAPTRADAQPHVGVRSSNRCVVSQCESSADCNGFACGYSRWKCDANSILAGFYCRTPEDECHLDSDCSDGKLCMYDYDKAHWACGPENGFPGCN